MQTKSEEYLANIFKQVADSVATVNATITAYKDQKIQITELQAIVAVQQLATQHSILIAAAVMLFNPQSGDQKLPEMPKKIIGFN